MISVITHNGVFHADDVFAVAAILLLHPQAEVFRTRDRQILERGLDGDIVVDVGGVYNLDVGMYDHHQRGGAGTRDNGVPYASFGLIWNHLGTSIVSSVLGWDTETNCAEVAQAVDEVLVQPVDAADCGWVSEVDSTLQGFYPGILRTPRYSISAAISAMNPSWQVDPNETRFDMAFSEAVEIAQSILKQEILRAEGQVLAVSMVKQAISLSHVCDPRLVILPRFCPWLETVIEAAPEALFVAFPSEDGQWRLQCIPPSLGSFDKKHALPEAWGGLRDQELAEVTGVKDAVFCHIGRFIAGTKSSAGILQMAALALLTAPIPNSMVDEQELGLIESKEMVAP